MISALSDFFSNGIFSNMYVLAGIVVVILLLVLMLVLLMRRRRARKVARSETSSTDVAEAAGMAQPDVTVVPGAVAAAGLAEVPPHPRSAYSSIAEAEADFSREADMRLFGAAPQVGAAPVAAAADVASRAPAGDAEATQGLASAVTAAGAAAVPTAARAVAPDAEDHLARLEPQIDDFGERGVTSLTGLRSNTAPVSDPLREVILDLVQGWGDLGPEDLKRLEIFRPEKVLEVAEAIQLPKAAKSHEYAAARLLQIRQYAAAATSEHLAGAGSRPAPAAATPAPVAAPLKAGPAPAPSTAFSADDRAAAAAPAAAAGAAAFGASVPEAEYAAYSGLRPLQPDEPVRVAPPVPAVQPATIEAPAPTWTMQPVTPAKAAPAAPAVPRDSADAAAAAVPPAPTQSSMRPSVEPPTFSGTPGQAKTETPVFAQSGTQPADALFQPPAPPDARASASPRAATDVRDTAAGADGKDRTRPLQTAALAFLEPAELSRVFAATSDPNLKKAIIDNLEQSGSPSALDVLRSCLDDPDPDVQIYALEAADRMLAR